jgi:heme exporter protein A
VGEYGAGLKPQETRGRPPYMTVFGSVFVLDVQEIWAIRGERRIFGPLSFSVAKGGAMLLIGPNGAGKSTLLRIVAGLGRLAEGRVLWEGENTLADKAAHAALVSYVGHLDAVKPGLTARENLGDNAIAGLAAMALSHLADQPARFFSAGQKRRLALSRLACQPRPIWLLDEPTLGLDVASVARFGDMLARHRADGGIVLAATHLPLPLPDARELRLS